MINRQEYHLPDHLPGGMYDAAAPFLHWILDQLRNAYADGYLAGRMDALTNSHRRPPSGGAVVTI